MVRTKESRQIRVLKAIQTPVEIQAEYCRRSFYFFMQEFWPEVSSDTPLWNWHIEYLCNQLEKLAKQYAAEWEDIEIEYVAESKKADEAAQAEEIRKQLGL